MMMGNMPMDQMGGGMNASATMSGNMANMNMSGMVQGGYMDPNAMGGIYNHGAQGMAGYGAQGMVGNGSQGLFGNLDLNSFITTILNFGIKLFLLLLVIGLVVGTFVYLKKFLENNGVLTGLAVTEPKATCTCCGQTLKKDWKVCPNCGTAKAAPVATQAQTV